MRFVVRGLRLREGGLWMRRGAGAGGNGGGNGDVWMRQRVMRSRGEWVREMSSGGISEEQTDPSSTPTSAETPPPPRDASEENESSGVTSEEQTDPSSTPTSAETPPPPPRHASEENEDDVGININRVRYGGPAIVNVPDELRIKTRIPGEIMSAQLKLNPYARALATPVRQCLLTRTRLPKYFLQPFSLVQHPETGTPHFLPRTLSTNKKLTKKSDLPTYAWTGQQETAWEEDDEEDFLETLDDATKGVKWEEGGLESQDWDLPLEEEGDIEPPTDTTQCEPASLVGETSASAPTSEHYVGVKSHVLSSHDLINQMTLKPSPSVARSRHYMAHMRFPPDLYKSQRHFREDMADWILELRRRRIVEWMEYLAPPLAYFSNCGNKGDDAKIVWENVRMKKYAQAVLLFDDVKYKHPPSSSSSSKGGSIPETVPAGRTRKSQIQLPVFYLPTLLGREKVEALKNLSRPARRWRVDQDGNFATPHPISGYYFNTDAIVVKDRRATAELVKALWGVKGYLGKIKDQKLEIR